MGQPGFATEEILFTHVRLLCSVVYEWWVYCIVPQSPPWSVVRVLSQNVHEREAAFVHVHNALQLVRNLEPSCHANASRFLRTLLFRSWPAFYEPLNRFDHYGWGETSLLPMIYIREMVNKLTHSLMEEHGFNALRDNEQRGARHHQRGEAKLASLAIATCKEHYPNVPGVEINPEDVTSFSSVQVSRSGFHPATVHEKKKDIGVNATALLGRRSWPSTSMDQLALNRLCFLRALLVTASDCWDRLWLAGLFVKDVITARVSTGMFYYVLGATRWMLYLWRLCMSEGRDDVLTFDFAADAFVELTVTSLDDFIVYPDNISLIMSRDATAIQVELGEAMPFIRFSVRTNWKKLTNVQLKDLLNIAGARGGLGGSRQVLVERLLIHLDLMYTEDGQRTLEGVREKALKHMSKRKKTEEEDQSESSSDSDGTGLQDDVPPSPAENRALRYRLYAWQDACRCWPLRGGGRR